MLPSCRIYFLIMVAANLFVCAGGMINAPLMDAKLNKVVCSHKCFGTTNREPPFGVPTVFVGTSVLTNLWEQPLGNQQVELWSKKK